MTRVPERIGFIGIGLIGRPMVMRLLQAGRPVTIWGRRPDRLQDVLEAGACWADSAAKVARASDVIVLCVADTSAVEQVLAGDEGLAAGLGDGQLVIDMGTTDVTVTRRLAATILQQTGAGWLDAPISGGPAGALAGTLAVMAGGELADFERARPVVACFSSRFTLMGPVGAGQTAKMVNQVIVGGCKAVIAEAIQLASNLGIDPLRLPEAFDGGRADSTLLRQSVAKMAGRDYSATGGHLRTMMKDLNQVMELGRATGTPMPMTALATELHRIMVAHGHGELDSTSTIALLRNQPIV